MFDLKNKHTIQLIKPHYIEQIPLSLQNGMEKVCWVLIEGAGGYSEMYKLLLEFLEFLRSNL